MTTETASQLPIQRNDLGYVEFHEGLPFRVAKVQETLEAHGYARVEDDGAMDNILLNKQLEGYESIMLVYGTTTGASALELWPEHYWRNISDFVPNRQKYYQKGFYMVKEVKGN